MEEEEEGRGRGRGCGGGGDHVVLTGVPTEAAMPCVLRAIHSCSDITVKEDTREVRDS